MSKVLRSRGLGAGVFQKGCWGRCEWEWEPMMRHSSDAWTGAKDKM